MGAELGHVSPTQWAVPAALDETNGRFPRVLCACLDRVLMRTIERTSRGEVVSKVVMIILYADGAGLKERRTARTP